jgi:hypothetical protein
MSSKRKNKTTKRNKHMRNKKSKTVRKFRRTTGGELDYLSVSDPGMLKYLQQRQAEDEAKKLKKEIDKKRRETVAMYEGV